MSILLDKEKSLKIKEYFQDYYSSGDLRDLRRLSTKMDNSIIKKINYQ